jgi:BirA family transcriptional regulator, biotin operon repressor / biotin---[acetyl-CoA-carboxylase] ligase
MRPTIGQPVNYMQIAYQVLHKLAGGEFYSGQALASLCKVSRARIWQAVELLRSYGLNIHAVKGKGYSLLGAIELIDSSYVKQLLKGEAVNDISKLETFNQIDSTNAYILRSLSRIETGFVCLAEGQSKGRGRAGKGWFSPLTKNIAFSYYQVINLPVHQVQALSLIVGIAVVKAIESVIGPTPGLGIKWPNDIWYKGAKLSGILVESHTRDAKHCGIVIGVGLNTHKIDLALSNNNITSLEDITGKIVSRNQMIAEILNQLIPSLNLYTEHGLKAFTQDWAHYDLLMGESVALNNYKDEKLTGIARGINEQGAMVVEHNGASKAYLSADIQVRPYATTR